MKECEQYYENKQIKLSRYDIVQSYMVLGGIPYYLSYFDSGQSLAQNIDNLFFVKNAKLRDEFDRLFASVLKKALGIMGVSTKQSSWALRGNDEEEGMQIDLIIQRADHIVNMCEMKFYGEFFTVDKSYHQKISHREKVLTESLSRKEMVHPILITTYGVVCNEYSSILQNVIIIDQLFE